MPAAPPALPTWDQVTSDPRYQNLPGGERLGILDNYDALIKNTLGEAYNPDDVAPYLDAERQKIAAEGQNPISTAARSFMTDAGQVATGSLQGLGTFGNDAAAGIDQLTGFPGAGSAVVNQLIPGMAAYRAAVPYAEAAQQGIEDFYQPDRRLNPISATIGGGAGQAVAMLPSMIAGPVGPLALGAMQGYQQGAEQATDLGIQNPFGRMALGAGFAGSETALNRIGGIGAGPMRQAMSDVVTRIAGQGLKTIASEAIEEPITGVAQDAMSLGAGYLAGTEQAKLDPLMPTAPGYLERRAMEALGGAVGGTVFAGISKLAQPKMGATSPAQPTGAMPPPLPVDGALPSGNEGASDEEFTKLEQTFASVNERNVPADATGLIVGEAQDIVGSTPATGTNQESAIRNPESGIRNPESGIRNPESEISNQAPVPSIDNIGTKFAPPQVRAVPVIPDSPLGKGDSLDFLNENPIALSRSDTGGELDWQEKAGIPRYYRPFIASETGRSIDKVAEAAYEANLIKQPTADALMARVNEDINARRLYRVEGRKQTRDMLAREKQEVSFDKSQNKLGRQPDALAVPTDALVTGDRMTIDGEEVIVRAVESDEDGYPTKVVLEDGKKFGVQEFNPQTKTGIFVDEFQPRPRAEGSSEGPFSKAGPQRGLGRGLGALLGTPPPAPAATPAPAPASQRPATTLSRTMIDQVRALLPAAQRPVGMEEMLSRAENILNGDSNLEVRQTDPTTVPQALQLILSGANPTAIVNRWAEHRNQAVMGQTNAPTPFTEAAATNASTPRDSVMSAYAQLDRTGQGYVRIPDLARASGLPMADVREVLIDLSDRGAAYLTPADEPRNIPPADRSMLVVGPSGPSLYVTMTEQRNASRGAPRNQSYAGPQAVLSEEMRYGLDTARAMAADGKTPEQIRAITGWFPGKYDGKMRFEVPDNGARLKAQIKPYELEQAMKAQAVIDDLNQRGILDTPERDDAIETLNSFRTNANISQTGRDAARGFGHLLRTGDDSQVVIGNMRGGKLAAVLDHPALFSAYPELADVLVVPSFDEGTRGGFNGGTNTINVHWQSYPNQMLSTLLHEVQHWIQRKEGFARGSSPDMWKAKHSLLNKKVDELNAYMSQKLKEGNREEYAAAMSERQDVVQEILKLQGRDGVVGADQYQRTAGEIESRDVQARQTMTPEERAATAPYSAENIAPEDAIVLYGDNGPQASMAPRPPVPMTAKVSTTLVSGSGMDRLRNRITEAVKAVQDLWQVALPGNTRSLMFAAYPFSGDRVNGDIDHQTFEIRIKDQDSRVKTHGAVYHELGHAFHFIANRALGRNTHDNRIIQPLLNFLRTTKSGATLELAAADLQSTIDGRLRTIAKQQKALARWQADPRPTTQKGPAPVVPNEWVLDEEEEFTLYLQEPHEQFARAVHAATLYLTGEPINAHADPGWEKLMAFDEAETQRILQHVRAVFVQHLPAASAANAQLRPGGLPLSAGLEGNATDPNNLGSTNGSPGQAPGPEARATSQGAPESATVDDAAYLAAVEAGDMETAQRMVDAAAKAAGYNVGPVWHGTPDGRFLKSEPVFKSEKQRMGWGRDTGVHWFADSKRTAGSYADDRRAFDYQRAEPMVIPAYVKLTNPLVIDAKGEQWRTAQTRGRTTDAITEAINAGNDGVIIRNVQDDYQTGPKGRSVPTATYAVFASNAIKSADPVTRDEQGNVIPLSQRFNPADERITRSQSAPPLKPSQAPGPEARATSQGAPESATVDDAAYLAAVEAGDMEKAQRMVDEAATGSGLETWFHGNTKSFGGFSSTELGVHLGTKESAQDRLEQTGQTSGVVNKYYVDIKNPVELGYDPDTWQAFDVWNALPDDVKNKVEDSYEYVIQELELGELKVELQKLGFDGIKYPNAFEGVGNSILVFDKAQIKSADPVTRDESGNVIPLSQRFNEQDNRITRSQSAPPLKPSRAVPLREEFGGAFPGHVAFTNKAMTAWAANAAADMSASRLLDRVLMGDYDRVQLPYILVQGILIGSREVNAATTQADRTRVQTTLNRLRDQLNPQNSDAGQALVAQKLALAPMREMMPSLAVDEAVEKGQTAVIDPAVGGSVQPAVKGLQDLTNQASAEATDELASELDAEDLDLEPEPSTPAEQNRADEEMIRLRQQLTQERNAVDRLTATWQALLAAFTSVGQSKGALLRNVKAQFQARRAQRKAAEQVAGNRVQSRGAPAQGITAPTLPETAVEDGAYVIADQGLDRAAWRSTMAKMLGPQFAPQLDALYEQALGLYTQVTQTEAAAINQRVKTKATKQGKGKQGPAAKVISARFPNLSKMLSQLRPMIAPGLNWKQIFTSTATQQRQWELDTYAAIRQHPALQNLNAEQAKNLTRELSKAWQSKRRTVWKRELNRTLIAAGMAKPKVRAKIEASAPRLLALINLGALDARTFRDAVAKEFGLKSMNDAEVGKIKEAAEKLQGLAPGTVPYRKAAQKFMEGLESLTNLSTAQLLESWWTASVLSGWRTQMDILFGVSNAMEDIGIGAVVGAIRTGNYGVASRAIFATIERAIQAVPEAFQMVVTGNRSLQASFDAEIRAHLEEGYPMMGQAGRQLMAKGGWRTGFGAFQVAMGRIMSALDHITSSGSRAGALWLARANHPEIFAAAVNITAQDRANARKQALQILTGGTEPTTTQLKQEVKRFTQELLDARHTLPDIEQQASDVGLQSSLQSDPTGLGFLAYELLRAVPQKMDTLADRAAKDNWVPTAVKLLRMGGQFSRVLFGTKFIRTAGNAITRATNYVPGIGALNLMDGRSKIGSPAGDIILGKQMLGFVLFSGLLYAFRDREEDDDMGIEGGWKNLNADQRGQLLNQGKQPYSVWYRDAKGRIVSINYQQWSVANLLAAVGFTQDQRRYHGVDADAATVAQGLGYGLMTIADKAQLQGINTILGRDNNRSSGADTVNGLNKWAAGLVGGMSPRLVKDIEDVIKPQLPRSDYWWQAWAREVPILRSQSSGARVDIFGREITIDRKPLSRIYQTGTVEPEYQILAKLNQRDVWISDPTTHPRKVKLSTGSRDMLPLEKDRYAREAGKMTKDWLLQTGPQLLQMEPEQAQKMISQRTELIRAMALNRAVRR